MIFTLQNEGGVPLRILKLGQVRVRPKQLQLNLLLVDLSQPLNLLKVRELLVLSIHHQIKDLAQLVWLQSHGKKKAKNCDYKGRNSKSKEHQGEKDQQKIC